MKRKPTCDEMVIYLGQGMSLRAISDKTGYSVPFLSDLCRDVCHLEVPSIGRPKGYRVSEETKIKISEANKKE